MPSHRRSILGTSRSAYSEWWTRWFSGLMNHCSNHVHKAGGLTADELVEFEECKTKLLSLVAMSFSPKEREFRP